MEMEELLAKYFTGEASDDERSFVERWRAQSEENALAFLDNKSIWLASSKNEITTTSFFDTAKQPKSLQVWLITSSWSKYVAAAILVFAIGLLFFLNRANTTPNSKIRLTDGSEIQLHKNSSYKLVSFNEHSREVRISGKAYFNIKRDEDRPFIIHTDNAKIAVLGTSFIVDADDIKTEVSVESGIVELSNQSSVSIKLERGELGIASNLNEGLIKKPNENPNYLAWKTKVITFRGTSIAEVAATLEDVYEVKVELNNSEFGACKLTARIEEKSLKEALEIISRTFEIDYKLKNNVATFFGKGC